MPDFKHGRVTEFLFNQYRLTRFFKMLRTKGDVDLLDGTTFGSTDKEFAGGFHGGEVSGEGLFLATDENVADADQVLDAALGAAVRPVGTIGPGGLDVVGAACKLFLAEEQQKDVNSSIEQLTMITASFLVCEGLRHGKVLAPLASYSANGNGASVDNGVATTNGAVAHLHVISVEGTDPEIDWKIQHSVDNSVWVDLITFTQATEPTVERIDVAGTVNRHTRAIRTIGGTDSPAFECAVAIARK